MKFILLALTVLAVVSANNYSGYIINYEQSGAIKPQASKENYSEQSLNDLLKYNFQVLSEKVNVNEDLVEDFGKGNLMNPVEMNYLFVLEGKEVPTSHPDNVRISVNQPENSEKLLDSVFNIQNQESLLRLTQTFFPNERRAPFYYYKSQAVDTESAYERAFGVELKRDIASNQVYFFDNQTQKPIGSKFNLQAAFEENFPQFRMKKDAIVKRGSAMKLEINEDNVKEVEIMLKDLVAVAKLSKMFKKSSQPNFVAFILNFEKVGQNSEIVQDLQKVLFKQVSKNFSNSIGPEKTFGQVVYVSSVDQVETEKVNGFMIPRILLEEEGEDNKDGDKDNSRSSQIKAWFSLAFVLMLFSVGYGMFTMNIQKDTLLYAKFITGDSR